MTPFNEDWKLGDKRETPNQDILNELFKDANLGSSGTCTLDFGNSKVSFESDVCSGIIDVRKIKCDPEKDDNCPVDF